MPRTRDLAIFVMMTDDRQTKPSALPLAHARGVHGRAKAHKGNNSTDEGAMRVRVDDLYPLAPPGTWVVRPRHRCTARCTSTCTI